MDERSGGLGVRFEIILIAESSRFFIFHSINWSVRAINQILVMVFAVFVVRRTSGSSLIIRWRSAPQSCYSWRNNNLIEISLLMETFLLGGHKLMIIPRKLAKTIWTILIDKLIANTERKECKIDAKSNFKVLR